MRSPGESIKVLGFQAVLRGKCFVRDGYRHDLEGCEENHQTGRQNDVPETNVRVSVSFLRCISPQRRGKQVH